MNSSATASMLLSEVGGARACVHDLCAIVVGWSGDVDITSCTWPG